jgi:hypothetical protein
MEYKQGFKQAAFVSGGFPTNKWTLVKTKSQFAMNWLFDLPRHFCLVNYKLLIQQIAC